MAASIHSRKHRGYRRLCAQPFLSPVGGTIGNTAADKQDLLGCHEKQRPAGSEKKLNAIAAC
jgi:hypothetical protein